MIRLSILVLNLLFFTLSYSQIATAPTEGSGTSTNPYKIASWENLYWISQSIDRWDKHYVQTADITFPEGINTWDGGKGWTPIGNYTFQQNQSFSGTYDGQSKKITGLYINRQTKSNVGLFGFTKDYGTIMNLGLEGVNITGNMEHEAYVGGITGRNDGNIINCYTKGTVKGWSHCGGLSGYARGKISNCYSTCNVTGSSNLGGLVGSNDLDNIITECYATGNVVGYHSIGGLVGFNYGFISKSYATGNVSLEDIYPSSNYAGGFVGWNQKLIKDSWSSGNVIAYSYVGGFVGLNGWPEYEIEELFGCEISNSYSTGSATGVYPTGGFAGYNYFYWDEEYKLYSEAVISFSFSNSTTSGTENGLGGGAGWADITSATTSEMKDIATFLDKGWDFQCETANGEEYIWGINSTNNGQIPFLSWQGFISTDCPQWTGMINSNWEEPGNWSNNAVPPLGSSIIIPQGLTNYPTLNQDQSLADMSIDAGTTLIVGSGINFSVEGALTNLAGTSGLVIKSDENGDGSLIHNSSGVSGTMERYIPGYSTKGSSGWHLLSSPVSDMIIAGSDFEPQSNDDFYAWDEVNYQWLNFKIPDNYITQFVKGAGYLVAYQSASSKDFIGTFYHTDVTHTNLSKTTGKGEGWHLLGNPFQSAIKWNDGNWNLHNVGTGAKIMNPGGTYTDILTEGENEYIPANQGFFVKMLEHADNSITIPAASRVHESTAFYKNTKTNLLTLRASDGEYYVEIWLQIMDNATVGYDKDFDVPFFAGVSYAPQLYSTVSESGRLSTNRIGKITDQTLIPLGFKSSSNAQITITARNTDSFDDATDVYLIDTKEDIQINLKETPEYTFLANANELTDRFGVLFLSATGIYESKLNDEIKIFINGDNLHLHADLQTEALISVYNLMGQQVYNNKLIINGAMQIKINATEGWYVVRLLTEKNAVSSKVFLSR